MILNLKPLYSFVLISTKYNGWIDETGIFNSGMDETKKFWKFVAELKIVSIALETMNSCG